MSEAQLPAPLTGGEMYLAAILGELRQLNQRLASLEKSEEIELREPKAGPPAPSRPLAPSPARRAKRK